MRAATHRQPAGQPSGPRPPATSARAPRTVTPARAGRAAIAVEAGDEHTCVLLVGGGVACWGFNGYGQLGVGSTASVGTEPGQMGNQLKAVSLGSGSSSRREGGGGGDSEPPVADAFDAGSRRGRA